MHAGGAGAALAAGPPPVPSSLRSLFPHGSKLLSCKVTPSDTTRAAWLVGWFCRQRPHHTGSWSEWRRVWRGRQENARTAAASPPCPEGAGGTSMVLSCGSIAAGLPMQPDTLGPSTPLKLSSTSASSRASRAASSALRGEGSAGQGRAAGLGTCLGCCQSRLAPHRLCLAGALAHPRRRRRRIPGGMCRRRRAHGGGGPPTHARQLFSVSEQMVATAMCANGSSI